MSDLIDRGHFHERFLKTWEWCEKQGINTEAFSYVEELINTELSAQPETGHWISGRDEDGWHTWLICSECGAKETNMKAKYCPMCGRKMV